jgi:amino acid transporter
VKQRPQEFAFARKASGLVRGLSFFDAFLVGFMNQGILPNLWYVTTLGVGIFYGANIIVAAVIALIVVGFSFPLIWGILGGTMPRSGGEYIYNSRILHPIVGLLESWGNAWVWIFWIYILAPWVNDIALLGMAQQMGWDSLATFAESMTARIVVPLIVNVLSFLTIAFGLKIMANVQKFVFVVTTGGVAVLMIVLSMYSKADFIAKWDALAAEHDSLTYAEVVPAVEAAAGTALPTTWNWVDTLGLLVAATYLFAYAYCITYISGEVKRPDKTIIMSNFTAIIVPAAFVIWMGVALYQLVDFQFVAATGYIDLEGGLEGYNVPYTPSIMGLGFMLLPEAWFSILLAAAYAGVCYWWCVLSYLATPRIMFAWGMDRMAPKWFTDVNPRFASPIKNYLVVFVISQILLFIYPFVGESMQSYTVSGLEWLTVFGVTAIAAILLPYRRKVSNIWAASPYRSWTFLGVSYLTIAGFVAILYIGLLFYFFIIRPELRTLTSLSLIMYGVIYATGLAWYLLWRQRSSSQGVDLGVTYGELPPE